jgi:hypothetical protein
MTEELVTLETVKLLRKKGFNEYCKNVIDINNIPRETLYRINDDLPKQCFSQPTQSITQKWLREIKNLHIEIFYMRGDYWVYRILTIPEHDIIELPNRPFLHYKSYEEALEAGLQEALELI